MADAESKPDQDSKWCANCFKTKPLSEFYPKRWRGYFSYQNRCKTCNREICVAYAKELRRKRSKWLPALIVSLSLLASLAPYQTANAGKWRDFCERYIFADDPYEGQEFIQEAKQRYPNENQLRQFLRDTYYSEINRPRPRRAITNAIEAFFGGKP